MSSTRDPQSASLRTTSRSKSSRGTAARTWTSSAFPVCIGILPRFGCAREGHTRRTIEISRLALFDATRPLFTISHELINAECRTVTKRSTADPKPRHREDRRSTFLRTMEPMLLKNSTLRDPMGPDLADFSFGISPNAVPSQTAQLPTLSPAIEKTADQHLPAQWSRCSSVIAH